MSEVSVPLWLAAATPFLGVVLGGLVSVLTTEMGDRRRLKRDRREKFDSLRREALAAALEWIEPMRNAEIRATSLVSASIRGEVEHKDFLERWPYLLGELKKRDLSGSLRAVLPDGLYGRGIQIVQEFEALHTLGVLYGQQARGLGKTMPGFQECVAKIESLRASIDGLEDDLRRTFRETFD